jgi:quinol monooxygenase YgiN
LDKLAMIGTFACKEGKAKETEAVLTAMVEAAEEEPGVEVYSYHRGDGNTYWFFALMTDRASMERHGQTDAMRAAVQALMPLAEASPQVSVTTPIAGLGLPL